MSNLAGDANGQGGIAVSGNGTNGAEGVVGTSDVSVGVEGFLTGQNGGVGVKGSCSNSASIAVFGFASNGGRGVVGHSDTNVGVGGESNGQNGVAILGIGTNGAIGIKGQGSPAGHFEGDVLVNGNISITGDITFTGADCAEEFDVIETVKIEPGMVMVLNQDGKLQQCCQAYDKKVAGVVSGAGDYKPGLILDRHQPQDDRIAVALVGKVYCKVDAQHAPIEVGDLLTTSSTLGYAMKASDPHKAFGTVLGKALRPLQTGQDIIPILVALQ